MCSKDPLTKRPFKDFHRPLEDPLKCFLKGFPRVPQAFEIPLTGLYKANDPLKGLTYASRALALAGPGSQIARTAPRVSGQVCDERGLAHAAASRSLLLLLQFLISVVTSFS